MGWPGRWWAQSMNSVMPEPHGDERTTPAAAAFGSVRPRGSSTPWDLLHRDDLHDAVARVGAALVRRGVHLARQLPLEVKDWPRRRGPCAAWCCVSTQRRALEPRWRGSASSWARIQARGPSTTGHRRLTKSASLGEQLGPGRSASMGVPGHDKAVHAGPAGGRPRAVRGRARRPGRAQDSQAFSSSASPPDDPVESCREPRRPAPRRAAVSGRPSRASSGRRVEISSQSRQSSSSGRHGRGSRPAPPGGPPPRSGSRAPGTGRPARARAAIRPTRSTSSLVGDGLRAHQVEDAVAAAETGGGGWAQGGGQDRGRRVAPRRSGCRR